MVHLVYDVSVKERSATLSDPKPCKTDKPVDHNNPDDALQISPTEYVQEERVCISDVHHTNEMELSHSISAIVEKDLKLNQMTWVLNLLKGKTNKKM